MAYKRLTENELSELKKSQYVLSATATQLQFSLEFNREFSKRILQNKEPSDILTELGISFTALGKARLNALIRRARKDILAYYKNEEKNALLQLKIKKAELDSLIVACDEMKAENLKLRQEVEFLKGLAELQNLGKKH
ncbi:MAG: hypothetical protein LBU04_04310 [Christensenellaceae bacterium]|jgi:hypothetical protein|nr:hypothetical protein [Christensenellaceae bacterium]